MTLLDISKNQIAFKKIFIQTNKKIYKIALNKLK